jgi:DHA3 family macrolide efflux protein-like MFS transporter
MTNENLANWKTPFFGIWTGQAISLLGSQLVQFALVWWLTETTGSATVLATATLVAILPGVVLGPFAGALVDRWNRRKVMIAADSFIALVSLGLAYLAWSGRLQVWHVYTAMLARALGDAFHWPAMQASTSLMVPERHLSRIAGLNQTLRGMLNITAPPLGALLLAVLPLHNIISIDVLTALVAIGPLLVISIPQPVQEEAAGAPTGTLGTLWSDMGVGLRYVWSWSGLKAVLILAMIINFVVNPAFSLMPLLVTDHFGGGAIQLGTLESGYGIGMVLGGLLLSTWGGFKRRILTSLIGLVISGVAIMGIGLAPGGLFFLAVGSLFVAGFMNPLVNGPLFAILQSVVAPEMQGRVFTLVGSLASAMMPISLAVAGPLSDVVGVRAWYVFGGGIFALLGVAAFFIPAVMELEQQRRARVTLEGAAGPAA